MKSNDRHQDQVLASRPYDGFCFEPVVHSERCREKVLHEELPAHIVDDMPDTQHKQRGLL